MNAPEPLEVLVDALCGALPAAEREGETLRLRREGGAIRIIVATRPYDPQVEHGLILPWLPPLADGFTLEGCHLRGRCRRSPEAVEAARVLAEGPSSGDAMVIAVEAAGQIESAWAPFTRADAWIGPGVEDLLRMSANASPQDVEPLLALVRAGACHRLGRRGEAREWMAIAAQASDPRLTRAFARLRGDLGDA